MKLVAVWVLLAAADVAFAEGDFRLAEAAKHGDEAAVRSLIKEHADVNGTQPDGTTALTWAAQRGDLATAELLIRSGAKVNAAHDYGVTALLAACTSRNGAVVEKLLDAGADANTAVPSGETALMMCTHTGALDGVKSLLKHGADVKARETRRGQTALMWAVAEKDVDVAAELIESGSDVNSRSKSGFTPLMFAARAGNQELVRILLGAGAKPNDGTPDDGTPLVVASASGQEALAIFLLDKGADPNIADGSGVTPLHFAAQRGLANLSGLLYSSSRMPSPDLGRFDLFLRLLPPPNMPDLTKALLAHGANPNARIKKDYIERVPQRAFAQMTIVGATPFFLAAAAADPDMMRTLVAAGADPLLGTNGGATPLMVAAGMGRVQDFLADEEKNALEAVKLTIELGGDIKAANIRGQTALHSAAYAGADTIIQFLADKGANVDGKDSIGQTPWTIAKGIVQRANDAGSVRVHESTVALLVKLGAQPTTLPPYKVGDRKANAVRYMIVDETLCGAGAYGGTDAKRPSGCTD